MPPNQPIIIYIVVPRRPDNPDTVVPRSGLQDYLRTT